MATGCATCSTCTVASLEKQMPPPPLGVDVGGAGVGELVGLPGATVGPGVGVLVGAGLVGVDGKNPEMKDPRAGPRLE